MFLILIKNGKKRAKKSKKEQKNDKKHQKNAFLLNVIYASA
jgi:hypothetical protein|tara:strand:- start:10957 stop:11079 length:123 start_codon:yes stop_codon:yes gene_type:complete